MDPQEFIISRKRKKYKFALFANSPLCFEAVQWTNKPPAQVLEMGAGTGLFSVALAKAAPKKQHIAVDVKADRLQTGARIAGEEYLTNLRFLRVRADQLLGLLAPGSLESIWVTFPDPFSKSRSAKHRLTHPRYLHMYAELLQSGGALYFKTDAHNLFIWSLEQLVQAGWTVKELTFDLHESSLPESYKVKTTYETRYIDQGLKIHFLKATPPL